MDDESSRWDITYWPHDGLLNIDNMTTVERISIMHVRNKAEAIRQVRLHFQRLERQQKLDQLRQQNMEAVAQSE